MENNNATLKGDDKATGGDDFINVDLNLPINDKTETNKNEIKKDDDLGKDKSKDNQEDSNNKGSDNQEKNKEEDSDNKKPEAVDIDGKTFKLDENGNAIDEENKIVKTKEELDALVNEQSEQQELPLPKELIQNIGIEILDENGKPKEYEESVNGLVNLVKDVAEEINKKEKKEFFETFPVIADLVKHLQRGGKQEDFFKAKTESWLNVSLKEADEITKLDIIVKDLVAKGFEAKDAIETANLYKDTNKLDEKSEIALKSRQEAEKLDNKQKDDAINREIEEENKKIIETWKNVEKVVNKGKLSEIFIPEIDKKGFYEYISKAVNEDGYSQLAIDRAELEIEQKLLLDYLVYKKLDLSKLVKNIKITEKTTTLRGRLQSENSVKNLQNKEKDLDNKKSNQTDIGIDDILN